MLGKTGYFRFLFPPLVSLRPSPQAAARPDYFLNSTTF
jgi:hypothetical protein